MSKIQENFNAIIKKIEERITDPELLDFVKKQIADISMIYIDELNKIIDLSERRVNQVYENQKILEKKIMEVEKSMDVVQKELFINDEDYDFEIVCPYCNYEFVSDLGSDIKEVECPECHNIIELDWNAGDEEHGCTGHCHSCEGCETDEEEIESEEDSKNNETNNEDDM